MRIVGNQHRGLNEASPSPQEAWRRGRLLDAMLPNVLPRERGAWRLTHAQRNARDDARMLEAARRLNAPQIADGST